jgi:hypothetical protein
MNHRATMVKATIINEIIMWGADLAAVVVVVVVVVVEVVDFGRTQT